MGKKIVLTGTTLTDTDAPQLAVIDAIESTGSLLLIEPMHPYAQWDAGVPSNGATIPNLLKTTLSTGDATFALTGGINNGTKGKIERSTKGGLHGIVSQSTALAAGDGAQITIAPALTSYLSNNAGHDYYISIWDRLTRINANSGSGYAYEYTFGAAGSNGIATATGDNSWAVAVGVTKLGTPREPVNTVGPRLANILVSGTAGFAAGRPSGPVWGAPTGSFNAAVLGSRNTNWPSFVFYRFYLEDMTVSGRTYAEVDAIDYALYTKHVLTAGGRYYGDTFTDPATLV